MPETTTRRSGASSAPPAAGVVVVSPTAAAPVAAHGAAGDAVIKDGYDPRLTNADLAPLREQRWGSYDLFAFWMSDVHSVGGYVTAGSLFALGLASWQVFVALIAGISIVYALCNLVAKPSQVTGVPYAVVNRAVFGVKGANIPAVVRGAIAVAWYGIQTYLASAALDVVLIRLWPGLTPYADASQHGFLGLSVLGYATYAFLWAVQAAVFWRGMEAIRRFIDFCGPAVYVVMFVLCGYLLVEADFDVSLTLSEKALTPLQQLGTMLSATALVVAYFSGPMLNFGDFSRYARTFGAVKKGNLLGLPVNFVLFSLLTVLTAAATLPVYGRLITDPVETVAQIDSTFAVVLGAVTFTTATIGINIVANFIAPAFDFSNVSPQKISWRTGGMIAAVGSVVLTPWNWYANDTAIHYTLGILGALIGPLFGVLIADYYLVRRQRIAVDAMYSMDERGGYWYRGGYNPDAVIATGVAGGVAIASVLLPRLVGEALWVSDWSWFIGCGFGLVVYRALALRPGSPTLTAVAVAESGSGMTDGTAVTAVTGATPQVVDVR